MCIFIVHICMTLAYNTHTPGEVRNNPIESRTMQACCHWHVCKPNRRPRMEAIRVPREVTIQVRPHSECHSSPFSLYTCKQTKSFSKSMSMYADSLFVLTSIPQ